LGEALLAREGVPVSVLRPALVFAESAIIGSRVEACILEPIAAASLGMGPDDTSGRAHSAWLVLDVGAGTTDLAGVEWMHGLVREIADARRGLVAAGDEIDRVVMERALAQAKHVRSIPKKTEMWRRLMTEVRTRKVELFAAGATSLSVEGKSVTLRRADVEKDRDFKRIRNAIAEAFGLSLKSVCESDGAREAGVVCVIVAGGGAGMKFVRDIAVQGRIEGDKARHGASVRTRIVQVGAEWRRQTFSEIDEQTLTQLAIALGGAIAPLSLLTDVSEGEVTQSYPME
jgi:hypothetical protein